MRLIRHKSLFFALCITWMSILLISLIVMSVTINVSTVHLVDAVSMMMTIIAVLFVWVYDYTLKGIKECRRQNDVG